MEISVVNGKSKKTGKDYEAVKVVIGDYETLIFPTKFEMKYIKEYIEENGSED